MEFDRFLSGIGLPLSVLSLALTATIAGAQPSEETVTIGPTTAVVHRPESGTPNVAVLHEDGQSVNHPMRTELARRGSGSAFS